MPIFVPDGLEEDKAQLKLLKKWYTIYSEWELGLSLKLISLVFPRVQKKIPIE